MKRVVYLIRKYAILLYVLFLIVSYLIVKFTLKSNTVKIIQKSEQKTEVEVHPADVTLILQGGPYQKQLRTRLKTSDTILSLLEEMRDNKKIYFEKTEYAYGMELEQVDNIQLQPEYVWRVLNGNTQINDIEQTYLEDEKIYILKPVIRISEPL